MPSVQQGAILFVKNVPDRHGNLKDRPILVVTATEDIKPDRPFEGIAITTDVPKPLPADHVCLPFNPHGGHLAVTGLNKKNAAVCSWAVSIEHSQVDNVKGQCPGWALKAVLAKIRAAGQSTQS